MKIRNSLGITIIIVLGTLCAQAQERFGSMRFTDHLKQGITISRFGTVLSFTDSNGKEVAPDNTYRMCSCGRNSQCIESANDRADSTLAQLDVEFPKQGATLKKGQTLVVTATVRQGPLILKRRVAWVAGSSMCNIAESISASTALALCDFEERVHSQVADMCPGPPGRKCPPKGVLKVTPGKVELDKCLFLYPWRWQLLARFAFDFSKVS